jgi:bifunctional non-homologous end joining protein LigD
MMKKMHWVNPKFVAQIKFAEWTRDGKLRQPVFLGMREDKEATEVRREAG